MTLLEQIAQQRTNDVVYTSVSLTIEKIATEAAKAILQTPGFREALQSMALASVARSFRDLHKNERRARKPAQKAKRR